MTFQAIAETSGVSKSKIHAVLNSNSGNDNSQMHHLDGDKSNGEDWNLAALCQRCHLHIQGKVFMAQFYMFEHSEWFKPHVEGYYNYLIRQLEN